MKNENIQSYSNPSSNQSNTIFSQDCNENCRNFSSPANLEKSNDTKNFFVQKAEHNPAFGTTLIKNENFHNL